MSAYAASLMNGIRMRFETKPGKSRASAGSLPRSRASCDDRRRGLVGRLHGADHLDELEHRHGVEEVHADHALRSVRHRRERRDRDRRRVGREDRAVAAATSSARRKTSSFASASSTTASIIRSASTRSSTGCHAREHVVGRRASFLREPLEALAHRREPALDRARKRIVQRHAAARRGDDLRDAAAHLPRADDEDVLELHARRLQRDGRGLPRSAAAPAEQAEAARARVRRRRRHRRASQRHGKSPACAACVSRQFAVFIVEPRPAVPPAARRASCRRRRA